MKNVIMLFIALALCAAPAFAQPPDTQWSRTFGGSEDDICSSVQQTSDGGYILMGYTGSFGNDYHNYWMVKTNSNGDSLWSRVFGGPGTQSSVSWAGGEQTADGGYLMAGNTDAYGAGGDDFWLVKTDSVGDSLWCRTYGGSGDDYCYRLTRTPNGGYLLAGLTRSFGDENGDFWMVKVNSDGDSLWSRSYGGSGRDYCYYAEQTRDGGYVLGGWTESFGAGSSDVWLVKTNAAGDTLWTRTYGGSQGDACFAGLQTEDDGYVLAGRTQSIGAGNYDVWLLRINSSGDTLWTRTYGGDNVDNCYSIRQTPDGGYILGGWTRSFGSGNYDFWVLKVNANGDSLWSRTFGGGQDDLCNSVQLTSDGGYVLAGYTKSYGSGQEDFWMVKTGPELTAENHPGLQPALFTLSAYPNPFNPATTIAFDPQTAGHISLRVFDVLGREVAVLKDGFVEAGSHRAVFDGSKLASGVYFVRLDAGKFSLTKKLMLLK